MSDFILQYQDDLDSLDRYVQFKQHFNDRWHYRIVTGRANATVFNETIHADNASRQFCKNNVAIKTIYVIAIETRVGELCTL